MPALRVEWRRFYRAHPPKRVTRDPLMLGVAWKTQEQAYGRLGAMTNRRVAPTWPRPWIRTLDNSWRK